MEIRAPAWMESLKETDPEFAQMFGGLLGQVMRPGALDAKTKALICLAIDAAAGHRQGTANLAKQARALGATDEEIKETIRLAFITAGIPGLVTGLVAFAKGLKEAED